MNRNSLYSHVQMNTKDLPGIVIVKRMNCKTLMRSRLQIQLVSEESCLSGIQTDS